MTRRVVAIIGGSVAGSEAAKQLAEHGIYSVVFEQNPIPYGKIEYGLPKWHFKLRDRQEALINQKLDNPYVYYIPNMKLGRDFQIRDLIEKWHFAAVLLALGAWRDRPLPIPDINQFVGKGLLYMTAVTNWFNQCHDPNYQGPNYIIPYKKVAVIGGGLASIDIIKIVTIRQLIQKLTEKGLSIDALTVERKGVFETLKDFNLKWEDLHIEPPKLFVRRSIEELPLTVLPENPTPAQLEQAAQVRRKLIQKLQQKFPFEVVERYHVKDKITKNDQLSGLVFLEKGEKERLVEVETDLVIAAIGAIPEPLPGIPMKGELYDVEDPNTGKIRGLDRVFALGNAVTGRGNIQQSKVHSKQVTEFIVDEYLSVDSADYEKLFEERSKIADRRVAAVLDAIYEQQAMSKDELNQLETTIKKLQEKVGYDGNFKQWVKSYLPVRLEKLIGLSHA